MSVGIRVRIRVDVRHEGANRATSPLELDPNPNLCSMQRKERRSANVKVRLCHFQVLLLFQLALRAWRVDMI